MRLDGVWGAPPQPLETFEIIQAAGELLKLQLFNFVCYVLFCISIMIKYQHFARSQNWESLFKVDIHSGKRHVRPFWHTL